ncbi:MAG: diguanylate cyclase [Deltaproteobacteria bacterium]|nr:diguanylate cyclase [Deltaproteobacteria bacterium]
MNAPIGVFISNPDGRLLYANAALARMLGYGDPQDLIASIVDIDAQIYADPKDREKITAALEQNHETLNQECRFLRRDGAPLWVSFNVRTVKDEGGGTVGYQGFIWDVTERKRERESLLMTQFAMDRAPDSILWVDHEGRIVYANQAACRSMEFTPDELSKMTVFEIDPDFHFDQWEQHKEEVRRRGSLTFEGRHRTKDGRLFPVEVSTNHFYYKDQYLACAFDRDISKRKEAEEKLRETERRLQLLSDNIPDSLIYQLVAEPDGTRRLSYVSGGVEGLHGIARQEAMADPQVLYHQIEAEDRQRLAAAEEYSLKTMTLLTIDIGYRKPDGVLRWSQLRSTPRRLPNGAVVWDGIEIDITGRKRMEDALRKSESKYRKLSIVDGLTRLYNSRYFYNQLRKEINRANRYRLPLALLLMDIDDFKAFNDTYGHIQGDWLLSQFGQLIKKKLRRTDFAFRYGGEEFAVLFPMAEIAQGIGAAEKIRSELGKKNFSPVPGQEVRLTVSIGIAQYQLDEDMKSFAERVDRHLYRAKRQGKDRVCAEGL